MLNPIGFRPGPVTFWTTLVYLALLIPVIVINEVVPPVPKHSPYEGVNVTEAWLDLTTLTSHYHPYNSLSNAKIRDWLLLRIEEILNQNGALWTTEISGANNSSSGGSKGTNSSASVVVFNDLQSNITFVDNRFLHGSNVGKNSAGSQAVYFEGTNVYVYIRGMEDDEGPWWRTQNVGHSGRNKKGGTMVNAHYDSVSSGFGATDNGMGVVTVLQLIKYFSTPEHQPRRGIVALLNNGEEDGLYGARVFDQSPLLPFIHTFLNLEGAGAGGRAILFRSSGQEVTAAYAKTSNPFGSVVGSDMFSLGAISSSTDYSIFKDVYGQRGLDLAFFKPRARYHTSEDDAKHTSRASLWHMMSAALHTVINLSGDAGEQFDDPRPDETRGKVSNGTPTDGVWFDILGKGFVLFNLRAMFAWSLAVLIAGPLLLLLVTYVLHSLDKYYFFTGNVRTYEEPDYESVAIGGWKGFLRFPIALVLSVALLVGSAFLLRKENPFVVYGSQYTVWAMMISLFYFVFWVIMRTLSFARPSALHRGYVHIWLFTLGWAILVAATVFEDRFHISAVYIFVFYESAVFLSTFITLLEMFALPKKTTWGQRVRVDHDNRDHYRELPPELISPTPGEAATPATREDDEVQNEVEPAHESTPLLGGGNATGENTRTTFTTTYRRSLSTLVEGARKVQESGEKPFEHEQPWSGHLPSTLWWFQFLILGPFMIILSAQGGLVLVDAVRQTGPDGSNLLLPFLLISFFTVLLLLPMTPFIHRVSHHVPIFLLVVFVATLAFNLSVFPFSSSNRYKAYWQQRIDLDTGATTVHVRGVEEYVRPMIAELPSASGQEITCPEASRPGLVECVYDGSSVAPNLSPNLPNGVPPQQGYSKLVTINVTRGEGNTARLEIDAIDTNACYITFKRPVASVAVAGSAWDDRFGSYPDNGVGLLQLWRRNRQVPWVVNVEWFDEDASAHRDGATDELLQSEIDSEADQKSDLKARALGLDGKVYCSWSDLNTPGVIPAYEEALKFGPTWGTWTKMTEALVEGSKSFKV